jgi:hypothetical protein
MVPRHNKQELDMKAVMNLVKTPVSEMRTLSLDEVSAVSGGVIKVGDGTHGADTHVPGPGADNTQRGRIAGAGLGGIS